MADILGFAGLGATIAAFFFALLALALPYWTTTDTSNFGLWNYCFEAGGTDTCRDPIELFDDDQDSDLKAVRAMVVLGFICLFAAIIIVALLLFMMKDQKILGFIGGGVAIVGGLFLMIGFAIFEDKLYEDTADHSAGFAFCILGWLCGWAAGGLILFAAIKGGAS